MTRLLLLAALALLSGCGGYFAPGGASLYCKDKDGRAIHCPPIPKDSTKSDTTRTR